MVFTKQLLLKRVVSDETETTTTPNHVNSIDTTTQDKEKTATKATATTVTDMPSSHPTYRSLGSSTIISKGDEDRDANHVVESSLRVSDVLMGRGSGPNQRRGNVRFRAMVIETFTALGGPAAAVPGGGIHSTRASSLSSSSSSSLSTLPNPVVIDAATKKKLAYKVLSKIKEDGGRFLRKLTDEEVAKALSEKANDAMSLIVAVDDDDGDGGEIGMKQERSVYVEVSDKQAMEKIKQTYRFLMEQKTGNKSQHVLTAVQTKRERSLPEDALSVPSVITTANGCLEMVQDGPNVGGDQLKLHLERAKNLLRSLNPPKQWMTQGYHNGMPPPHMSYPGIVRRSSLFAVNMAALQAEEEAVKRISARLVQLQEEERDKRRNIILAGMIKADAERSIAITNRLRALEEIRNQREPNILSTIIGSHQAAHLRNITTPSVGQGLPTSWL